MASRCLLIDATVLHSLVELVSGRSARAVGCGCSLVVDVEGNRDTELVQSCFYHFIRICSLCRGKGRTTLTWWEGFDVTHFSLCVVDLVALGALWGRYEICSFWAALQGWLGREVGQDHANMRTLCIRAIPTLSSLLRSRGGRPAALMKLPLHNSLTWASLAERPGRLLSLCCPGPVRAASQQH